MISMIDQSEAQMSKFYTNEKFLCLFVCHKF